MNPDDLMSVSVVIPCYRCAGTIERAIASVAAQTRCPAEVILVDDASGDDTRERLQKLSQRYESGWIKLVFLEQNVGAASARNAGWAVATQTYVAFLDADDAWHPEKIEIQTAYMEAHPDVVLSGHGYRRLGNDSLPDWHMHQGGVTPIHKWPLILSNKFVTPSVMLRRNVAHRFVEKQRYMEDHMLWLKIVCDGGRIVKLDTELAAIYKEPFGVAGLSAQVWLMERSDLGNYRRLYQKKYINPPQFAFLVIYSALKYVRRLLIYWSHLRWKK
jgi:glycosyltransferase involved in cell wall biosynthesis